MESREQQKQDFLTRIGWGEAKRGFLSGDASFRSYERLRLPRPIQITLPDGAGAVESMDIEFAVLMDAPPDKEETQPFIRMTHFLRQAGLRAPAILAQDVLHGFLLLEDFGDARFTRMLADKVVNAALLKQEKELYIKAVDALIHLHGQGLPEGVAKYDLNLLMKEVGLFKEWYAPWLSAMCGHVISSQAFVEMETVMAAALQAMPALAEVTVLRDYHADNLMVVSGARGLQALGVLDYQDAVIGSPAYDLVSLLEDARRDFLTAEHDNFVGALLHYYQMNRPEVAMDDLLYHYHVLGAQRNLKIIGIFCRLALRDGKKHYLPHLPRVFGHLNRDLRHPALSKLAQWVQLNIPAELQKISQRVADV